MQRRKDCASEYRARVLCAERGGFVELLVTLNVKVAAG
jgi:hypothetical protein